MTLAGLMNFLRRGQFVTQDQINKTIQEFQEMTPPLKGARFKSKTIKQGEIREKTSTFSTPSQDISPAETVGRGIASMRRLKPETVNSYPLVHTVTGVPSFADPADTMYGGGVDFGGSAYITIDDHSVLNVTDEITVACRINPAAASGDGLIFSKDNQYQLKLASSDRIQWRVYSSGTWKTALEYTYTPGTEITVVASYSSGGQSLFVNDSLVDSDSEFGAVGTSANDAKVGGDGTSNLPSGTVISWLSVLHEEVNATWRTDFENGLLDTSGTNVEITTLPFTASVDPKPDMTSGEFKTA